MADWDVVRREPAQQQGAADDPWSVVSRQPAQYADPFLDEANFQSSSTPSAFMRLTEGTPLHGIATTGRDLSSRFLGSLVDIGANVSDVLSPDAVGARRHSLPVRATTGLTDAATGAIGALGGAVEWAQEANPWLDPGGLGSSLSGVADRHFAGRAEQQAAWDAARAAAGEPSLAEENAGRIGNRLADWMRGHAEDLSGNVSPRQIEADRSVQEALESPNALMSALIDRPLGFTSDALRVAGPGTAAYMVPGALATRGARLAGIAPEGAAAAGVGAQAGAISLGGAEDAAAAVMGATIEDLRQIPEFQQLEAELGEEAARSALAEQAYSVALASGAGINTATMGLAQRYGFNPVGDMLAGVARRSPGSAARTVAARGLAEAGGEFVQEGGEAVTQELAAEAAGTREEGSGARALAQGLFGAGIGFPGGAMAGGVEAATRPPLSDAMGSAQPEAPAAGAGDGSGVQSEQAPSAAMAEPDLTPRTPATPSIDEGVTREQLVEEWRNAATPDARAAAAARIAAHDAQRNDAGDADAGPVDADGAAGAQAEAAGLPAQDRGAADGQTGRPEEALSDVEPDESAPRMVRDSASGRVEDGYADTSDPAITAALGSAARGITVHRAISDLRPEDQQRIGISDADTDVEGFYDPDTGRVHIFEDNLDVSSMGPNERKVWVAAHERSGHAGLRGMFADAAGSNAEGAGQLRATLRRAQQNETVAAVVSAMEQQRPERGDILTEEAIVELAAAVRTGNYQHITDRYGVEVPPAARASLRGYIERLIQSIKRALGRAGDAFTDADIFQLIEDAGRYAERGGVRGTSVRAELNEAMAAPPVASRIGDMFRKRPKEVVPPYGTPEREAYIAEQNRKGLERLEAGARDGSMPWLNARSASSARLSAHSDQTRGINRELERIQDEDSTLVASRVGTRNPTAVRATESGVDPSTTVGYESFRADPKAFERNTSLLLEYPGVRRPRGRSNPDRVAESFITHVTDNLLSLHDAMPADLRPRAKQWYVGARAEADRLSEAYGVSDVSAAATIAALSPQKDWFQNLSLAERVIDATVNRSDHAWDPGMTATFDRIFGDPKYAKLRAAVEGRPLSDLTDPVERAAWIRTYDQTHNDSAYPITDPQGGFSGTSTNRSGAPAQIQWGSLSEVSKAVSVLQDDSLQNVSALLGRQHKIRSFYNNIIAPNSDRGDVTIDTHAVAAALMRPLSAATKEVGHNFGTGTSNSSVTGNSGMYGLYAEAYRRAAAERGVLPREMQSITWEAVRALYLPSSRRPNSRVVLDTEEIWSEFGRRRIEHGEAFQRAVDAGGGIRTPDWAGSTARLDEGEWGAAFRPAVSGAGVPGRGSGPVASRRRGSSGADRGVHPDAAVTLNIGLSTAELRGGGELSRARVMRVLRRTGANVLADSRHVSDSEPTLVVDLDRPLTADEGSEVSAALDQEAIVQRNVDGTGDLFGPQAENWGPYNPAYFVMPDGDRADRGPVASRARNPQVDTPEFRRWFGDSKVVDENGDPMVVYHGASAKFDVFERGNSGRNTEAVNSDAGFFFTNDEAQADSYVGTKGRRVDAYIKIENPKRLRGGEYDPDASPAFNSAAADHADKPLSELTEEDVSEYVEYLVRRGHDGVEVEIDDGSDIPLLNWIAFRPEQIKSATGNRGTFDPSDPSIIASRGRRTATGRRGRTARAFSAKPRQPDAVSADAYHYSSTPGLTDLDPTFAGTAGAGRERRAFGMGRFGERGGTYARLNFYVREQGAEVPGAEDVVRSAGGSNLYRVQLDNLYDLDNDPRGIAEEAGQNVTLMEEEIADAGFDGFLAGPQPGIDTPVAVVFDLPGTVPVENVDGSQPLPAQQAEPEWEDPNDWLAQYEARRRGPVASRARNPQADTPEFRRWFGDSKVVDANGDPLVVYHGTGGAFTEFDTDNGTGGSVGAYFSEERSVASSYAERRGGQVYPVYLRMENPLTLPSKEFPDIRSGNVTPAERAALEAAGYDGIIGRQMGWLEYVTFRPEQIKSATGNRGTFDPSDSSIIASRRRTPADVRKERGKLFGRLAADGYQMGSPTQTQTGGRFATVKQARDSTLIALHDKMLPLLRAQQQVSEDGRGISSLTLDDAMNAYRAENLMHGAVNDELTGLHYSHIRPIQEAIRKSPYSVDMFEDYLYAKAAPERNREIAKINKAMPDAGSGIATKMAKDILSGKADGVFSGQRLTPEAVTLFDGLNKHVRALRNAALNNMIDAGQITPELAAALRKKYPNYIPMRGKDAELDEGRGRPGTGRGLSQRAANIRRALGRGADNVPTNILGELVGDAQRSVVAKGKGKVARAMLRFALANPNPDLYTVEPVDLEWRFSEATGEAYLGVKRRGEDVDTSMVIMHKGNPVYLRFNDPQLAAAMLNAGVEDMGKMMRVFSALNRWRSATLTRYNPAFTPVNMARDFHFGTVAIAAEHGPRIAAQTVMNYPGAMRASYRHAAGRRGDASKPDSEKTMQDWAAEAYAAGMSTGITHTPNVVDLQRNLQAATMGVMELAASGRPLAAAGQALYRTGRPIIDAIESANEASENAMRLGVYVALRKDGMSKTRAAEYAKNVTINFNRKGKAGPILNAIFLFYNAAMQGGHAVLRVMRNPKVMTYLIGLSVMQGLLSAGLMDDDDGDGITEWDKIPDYVKRTSLIFPLSEGKYFAMPMPYGFNWFTYLGGRGTQRMILGDRPTDSSIMVDLAKSLSEAFSPIPFEDGYRSLFGDQVGLAMGLAANRNDFGSPIAQLNPYEQYPEPRALQGRVTTPGMYHVMAQLMAKAGGGDLDERLPPIGWLDVAPEQIEELVNHFGGGITSLGNRGLRAFEQMQAGNLDGAFEGLSAAPITSRLLVSPSEARGIADRYYSERGEFARHKAIVDNRIAQGMPLDEAIADRPPEYFTGAQQATYQRHGRRQDGTRYRRGEGRADSEGNPIIEYTEGSPRDVLKSANRRVSALNEAVREIRAATITNAELAEMYAAHYDAHTKGLGQVGAIDGVTGRPADIGLPDDFEADATSPARVRNRAIKILQDMRAEEQRRLLRSVEYERTLSGARRNQ